MPVSNISNMTVRGIACAVPKRRETASNLAAVFGEKEAGRLVKGTGIKERRIDTSLCTSDLCYAATESLLEELNWERDSIDHLVFVSQSADYILPATACILQDRLKLSTNCTAFDVNLGCSGYPYGLWLGGKILEPGQRALLLIGDMVWKYLDSNDRSTAPIFGDAGSATAIEYIEESDNSRITFSLGSDGSGFKNIIIEAGGCRLPSSEDPKQKYLVMDGAEVFGFAIQAVPPLIMHTLAHAGWEIEDCDDFIFHQANGFMLNAIAEKIGIPLEKVPMSLENFGNTSSASIPLTLVTQRANELRQQSRNYILAGFGVGWSWAAASLNLDKICVPELIELESL